MHRIETSTVFNHWDEIRCGQEFARRSAVSPRSLKSALQNVFILGQEPDGSVRFRLAGSAVCALFGTEMHGRRFDDYWAEADLDFLHSGYRGVLHDMAPYFVSIEFGFENRMTIGGELLFLPMSSDGHHVDRILGSLALYQQPDLAARLQHHPIRVSTDKANIKGLNVA